MPPAHFYPMRNFIFLFALSLLLTVASGCLSNYYKEYYVSTQHSDHVFADDAKEEVDLKISTSPNDVIDLMEEGYSLIGQTSFYAPYTSFSCAIDAARKHHASLVLLDIQFKDTKEYNSITYVPSYSTSYTSGHIYTGYRTGSYSGTTTTTTLNAVPVQYSVDFYNHNALFFRKIDPANCYGAVFNIPQRLPDEDIEAPVTLTLIAVIHHSQAERDGLKRGQRITTINDIPIRQRKDLLPFERNEITITKIEAEDAE